MNLTMNLATFDVAIVGAGVSGLTCAQQLKTAGYSVIVLEKSRGVGGRCATRRIQGHSQTTQDIRVDHGLRCLEVQGQFTQDLIEQLSGVRISDRPDSWIQLWIAEIYQHSPGQTIEQVKSVARSQYSFAEGMNGVGKFLAQDLEIWFNRRVISVTPTDEKFWHLMLEIAPETATEKPQDLYAKVVVLAIPAPQVSTIIEPLAAQIPPEFYTSIHAIQYDPCITVMAGYPASKRAEFDPGNPPWKAIQFLQDPVLDWVGLDSSKRSNPQFPIFVLQSSSAFAQQFLDTTDLHSVGQTILQQAATALYPWLIEPEWMQIHRWRYGFCQNPLPQSCLTTLTPLPLIGLGDWCAQAVAGSIERALTSGTAAANWVVATLAAQSR
ncbi:MAG: NAD(P)/FAD-dependent oxidoreductase [Microcoleaceae cyanobacterium]